jgi:hypothetical protein
MHCRNPEQRCLIRVILDELGLGRALPVNPTAGNTERAQVLRQQILDCGVMPASCASSLAVGARPVISAVGMLAHTGSPTIEVTMVISTLHASMTTEALMSRKRVVSLKTGPRHCEERGHEAIQNVPRIGSWIASLGSQ